MENFTSTCNSNKFESTPLYNFFLDQLLKARIELKMQTESLAGNHEDENVYLAGLLESLMLSGGSEYVKPYVSAYDLDVRRYLEAHPGTANDYIVYKANADYGLIWCGIFSGYEHKGSYFKRVIGENNDIAKIALYYKIAANALARLRGINNILIHTFYLLASEVEAIIRLLQQVARSYFELIERISAGSMYHLEKEIEKLANKKEYDRLLDEFLREFSVFKNDPTVSRKQWLLIRAAKLKKLNEKFDYDELKQKLDKTILNRE